LPFFFFEKFGVFSGFYKRCDEVVTSLLLQERHGAGQCGCILVDVGIGCDGVIRMAKDRLNVLRTCACSGEPGGAGMAGRVGCQIVG